MTEYIPRPEGYQVNIDLEAAFERGLIAQFEANRRNDEEAPHVSDLGQCGLAVSLRRSGAEQLPKDTRTLQLMQKGLHDEEYVVGMLAAGLAGDGWRIIRSGVLADGLDLVGHLDVEIARMCCDHNNWADLDVFGWSCNCGPIRTAYDDLEGIFPEPVEYAYIEVKTTQWHERWEHLGEIGKRGLPIKTKVLPGPRPEPSVAHRLQALGYVLRRLHPGQKKPMPYAIFQHDRALNGFKQYPKAGEWYDPADAEWLARHDRALEIVALTAPGIDPVEAGLATINADGQLEGKAPEEWMHSYCNYFQCALNTNKLNPKHAVEVPF